MWHAILLWFWFAFSWWLISWAVFSCAYWLLWIFGEISIHFLCTFLSWIFLLLTCKNNYYSYVVREIVPLILILFFLFLLFFLQNYHCSLFIFMNFKINLLCVTILGADFSLNLEIALGENGHLPILSSNL